MKNDLAVIDTNVFVSSLIGKAGYSRKIFNDLIVTSKIKICISNDVFEAAYIVTGNSNDFIIKTYKGISICSPKEFYEFQSGV